VHPIDTGNRGITMAGTDTDDGKRQLSELRECFIELKARLDRNIKENQETMRNIANLNYYIDSLLVKVKKHFGS
jgi:predicted nuclease with TOPRIM domain